jgi:prolyl-tRNA editing enzyme YbaK/EbsC (Cys-tRNA(Pro) deacylase)
MSKVLLGKVKRVQEALACKGLDCNIIEFSELTRTAQEAAQAIGCDVAQIAKSLIFKTKSTNKPILLLVSGANRVNEKLIEEHLKEKITKADADFTREVTGFAIGGIPPIGHVQQINDIFIDKDLLKFEIVWAAAGTPNSVFNLTSENLVNITKGKIITLSRV